MPASRPLCWQWREGTTGIRCATRWNFPAPEALFRSGVVLSRSAAMQHIRARGPLTTLSLSCLVLVACAGQAATPTFSAMPARPAITPPAMSPGMPMYTATIQPPSAPVVLPSAPASPGTLAISGQQHGATAPQRTLARANVQAILIRDDWDTFLLVPPYHQEAHYDLERQGEHFVGQATSNLVGLPGNTRHANINLLVPGNVAQAFFGLLAAVEVHEGTRQLSPTKRILLDTTEVRSTSSSNALWPMLGLRSPAGGASRSLAVPMQSPRNSRSRRSTCSLLTWHKTHYPHCGHRCGGTPRQP